MRNILTTALVATVASLGFAGVASADTSVYNKYSTTHQYNGYSETDVDASIYSQSTTVTDSLSIKSESYGGTSNFSNVVVKDGGYTATSTSSNNTTVDPTAIVTVVDQHDVTTTTEHVNVDTFSSYSFSGTVYEHEA